MAKIVDHMPMARINGFPVPAFGYTESNFREIAAMKIQEGDVFLSTYPKCGTTWAQYIIWEILHDGAIPPSNIGDMMTKEIPFLEMVGTKHIEDMPSPRVFKLHLPHRLTPQSNVAKYIIVARNPFDACVSFYHHTNEIDGKIFNSFLRWETYFVDFVNGEVPCGSFFEFVSSWYERRNDSNVLFMFFEDMKENPSKAVLEIAKFLGNEHLKKLEDNPSMLETILKHTTFEFMKKHINTDIKEMMKAVNPTGFNDNPNQTFDINFFREGKVGGSKATISEDQWKILDRAIDENIQDSELKKMMKKTQIK